MEKHCQRHNGAMNGLTTMTQRCLWIKKETKVSTRQTRDWVLQQGVSKVSTNSNDWSSCAHGSIKKNTIQIFGQIISILWSFCIRLLKRLSISLIKNQTNKYMFSVRTSHPMICDQIVTVNATNKDKQHNCFLQAFEE